MILNTLEVSLSKEERRIVDEHGNAASTWARIGITAELQEGDNMAECIAQLKEEIQPQVDDWLLRQGGYLASHPELVEGPPGEPTEWPGEPIEEVEERLGALFGTEVKVSEVSPNGDADDDDDIPL